MKKIFSFFILYILVNLAAIAQKDPLFSNYMINRTFTNPGFNGAEQTINAVFNNRTMFAGFGEGRPVTSVFGADAPIDLFGAKSGVGLLIISDEFGAYSNVHIDASMAYHHSLQSGKLGGGVKLGIMDYSLATDNWYIPSDGEYFGQVDGDPLIPNSDDFDIVLGIGAGIYYETPEYYVGFSVNNINQSDIIFTRQDQTEQVVDYLSAHYYLTGAYNIELPNPLLDLHPSFMLRSDLAAHELDVNATFFYNSKYWFGGGLRTSFRSFDAVTLLGGMELMNGLNIGYAMDLNVNGMIMGGATSHEVFVTYSFNLDTKRDQKYKSIRYL